MNSFCEGLFKDLDPAFLRSTVACPTPTPSAAGECPPRYAYAQGHCRPDHWSGSRHCSDRAHVLNSAVGMSGELHTAGLSSHGLAMVLLGSLIDTWGRKPIVLLGIAGETLQVVFFLAAACRRGQAMLLLMVASLVRGVTSLINPTMNAMLTDLCQPTVDSRATAFAMVQVTEHVSGLLGVASGFVILRRKLEDYSTVWAAGSICMAAVLFMASWLLAETLPASTEAAEESIEQSSSSSEDAGCSAGRESNVRCCSAPPCQRSFAVFAKVISLVRNDGFLLQFILLHFFTVAALGLVQSIFRPFLIAHLGYRQETASLAGLAVRSALLLGNLFSQILSRRHGPYIVYGVGLGLITAGFVVSTFARPPLAIAEKAFWVGLAATSLGFGMSETSRSVILSLRSVPEAVGLLFTYQNLLGLGGHLLGMLVSAEWLFDARAKGWRASLCFAVAGVCSCLSMLWYWVAYLLLLAPATKTLALASTNAKEAGQGLEFIRLNAKDTDTDSATQ